MENEILRVCINLGKGAEIFEFRHKTSDVDATSHCDCPDVRARGLDLAANSLDAFFDQYTRGWQESFPAGNAAGIFDSARCTCMERSVSCRGADGSWRTRPRAWKWSLL